MEQSPRDRIFVYRIARASDGGRSFSNSSPSTSHSLPPCDGVTCFGRRVLVFGRVTCGRIPGKTQTWTHGSSQQKWNGSVAIDASRQLARRRVLGGCSHFAPGNDRTGLHIDGYLVETCLDHNGLP